MRFSIPLLLLFLIAPAGWASILPKNDLHLQDSRLLAANMSQTEFNQRIDELVRLWKPIASAYGANLYATKNWLSREVNAFASQSGRSWNVDFHGGFARRPEITGDAFSLVVCHELGHHFGGYFFLSSTRRMTAEGSADYFASQVCAPVLWGEDHNVNQTFRATADQATRRGCDAVWSDTRAQNLCYRIVHAGKSLSKLFAHSSGFTPLPGTPSGARVSATKTSHPEAQCRMDTFFQGALCSRDADPRVIPGSTIRAI